MRSSDGTGRTWLALAGLAAGALSAALLAPSCSLNVNPHEEPDGYEGYDISDGFFAEPPPQELPTGGCKPIDPPVYFDPDAYAAMKTLGCTNGSPCHGGGGGGFTVDPDDATTAYGQVLGRVTACGDTARLVVRPVDPTSTIHAGFAFGGKPEFEMLIAWLESCTPLSASDDGMLCGSGGGGNDGGPDVVVPPDVPPDLPPPDLPPPADMTGDVVVPPCNTAGLTYGANIDPILTGAVVPAFNCTVCHATAQPRLVIGNPTANYNALGGASSLMTRGFVYTNPGHPGGNNVITPGSCQDMQIRAWIQAGAPQ